MNCPTCDRNNSADSQFCGGCGASLSVSTARGIEMAASELPKVGLPQAIKLGFKNYANFSARATRAEYWWWVLFAVVPQIILCVGVVSFSFTTFLGVDLSTTLILYMIYLIWTAAFLVPSLTVSIRRLHDVGKSGWEGLKVDLALGVSIGVFGIAVIIAITFGTSGSGIIPILIMLILGFSGIIAATVWWIVLLGRQGEAGPNKHGPDPRQPLTTAS